MTHKKLSENGFTLVELLVAIAVGAIIVASLTQVVTNYIHLAQRGRYLNIANAYVEAKTESIRNLGYNSVTDGTTSLTSELPSGMPRIKSGTMTISSPSLGLKQLDITVSYTDQGQSQSYSYTTYVGELGVGQ